MTPSQPQNPTQRRGLFMLAPPWLTARLESGTPTACQVKDPRITCSAPCSSTSSLLPGPSLGWHRRPTENPNRWDIGSLRRAGGAVSPVLIGRTALTVGHQIEHINFRRPETIRFSKWRRRGDQNLGGDRYAQRLPRSAEVEYMKSRQRPTRRNTRRWYVVWTLIFSILTGALYRLPRRTGNNANHSTKRTATLPAQIDTLGYSGTRQMVGKCRNVVTVWASLTHPRSSHSCQPGRGMEGGRDVEPITRFPVSYHKLAAPKCMEFRMAPRKLSIQ